MAKKWLSAAQDSTAESLCEYVNTGGIEKQQKREGWKSRDTVPPLIIKINLEKNTIYLKGFTVK